MVSRSQRDADPSADDRVRYPCVIKPVGLSGSRGVMRANTPAELAAAAARLRALLSRKDVRAIRSGLDDIVLVEGFIAGREFAIEGVMTDGALQIFAIFDKPDPLDGPFFEETIYVTPSRLDREQQAIDRRSVARDGWRARSRERTRSCGVSRGETATVYVLEMAARPIGGLCSKVLRFHGLEDMAAAEPGGCAACVMRSVRTSPRLFASRMRRGS